MELMKTSIKAILDNIVCAEEFLDEDAINEFEDIIMNSKNSLMIIDVIANQKIKTD